MKQKKLKIKEDIRFRLSPDDDDHVFMIKSKSILECRGRHEVLGSDGTVIGLLEKDFRHPQASRVFRGFSCSNGLRESRRGAGGAPSTGRGGGGAGVRQGDAGRPHTGTCNMHETERRVVVGGTHRS